MIYWFKWAIKVFPALLAVFIISYGLIWVLWKWLWLSIPIFIISFFIYRQNGIMGKEVGFYKNLHNKNI